MMKRFTSLPLALAGLGLLVCPLLTVADTNADSDFNLRPLVVTTTLGTETADESLSSVTVISAENLESQQPRDLRTVLQGQPGVNVVTNGGFGKNTSVFIRGTGSESTVLLVDGIRLRSATSGSPPWQYLPPQLLNRIEIVRGPRSSLYGADAVGGVVQGFTVPDHGRDTAWVELGGGSFSTQQVGAGASGQSGNTRYNLQGNYLDTEGTRIQEGGDDKGFRNASLAGSASHDFDNGALLSVLALHSRGRTEFDSGETDFELQVLGVRAEVPITSKWKTSVQLSEARDEQDQVRDIGFFNTRSRTARWENTFSYDSHELVVGSEYLVDDVDALAFSASGFERFDEESRDNKAVFAQQISRFGPLRSQLSGRWDDNEAFGEKVTGALALGYDLDRAHTVRASYGTAFRAPTFNDLYYPGFGNPDLRAETSATSELGIRAQHGIYFWDLALYQTDADNLIVSAENINRARIRGAELSSGAQLGRLDLRSSLTLLDPRNRENDNRLPRRTIQSFRLDADYHHGRVNFGASTLINGDSYNDPDNDELISSFATADLRVGVRLAEKLRLRFTMENVFNRQYNTARNGFREFDYLAPGRTVFASLRYGVF